jgi:hypothetical protein
MRRATNHRDTHRVVEPAREDGPNQSGAAVARGERERRGAARTVRTVAPTRSPSALEQRARANLLRRELPAFPPKRPRCRREMTCEKEAPADRGCTRRDRKRPVGAVRERS